MARSPYSPLVEIFMKRPAVSLSQRRQPRLRRGLRFEASRGHELRQRGEIGQVAGAGAEGLGRCTAQRRMAGGGALDEERPHAGGERAFEVLELAVAHMKN